MGNLTFTLSLNALAINIFLIGLYGVVVMRRSILRILISFEIMLLGLNLNFIFFSLYLDDLVGQIFSLMILTVAAAESAVGLAILMIHYRLVGSTAIDLVNKLKG